MEENTTQSPETNDAPHERKSATLGEKAPGAPFMVVALTYLGMLTTIALAAAGLIYLIR